jgi:AsmA family protein
VRWTAFVLAGLICLVAVLFVILASMDWNALKPRIEQFASNKAGRTVKIAGPLKVHLWSWTPSVTVEGLSIGNPPWEKAKPMLQVERAQAQLKWLPLLKGDVILPRVEFIRPNVRLHRDASGRANWTFKSTAPTNAPNAPPPKLPVIRDFLVQDGKLTLQDEILHLEIEGTVFAHEKKTEQDPQAFRVTGKGTLNDKPFQMNVAGGPLVNLDPDQPYPFDLDISTADIRVGAKGSVRKPFDLARMQLDVHASGNDLADLYYLTQLALPNTPPYALSAHIQRNEKHVSVTNLSGKVGKSDLEGALSIDMSRKRPAMTGRLVSDQLRLADLGATLGGKPKGETIQGKTTPPKPSKKGAEESAPANARLFPTARLQVNRVRAMDADVEFRANRIVAGSLPIKEVGFHLKLDEGVLSLDPLAFELPQGKLEGTIRIDARGKQPDTRVDVRMRNIQLDQLKGKAPDAEPPLGGVLQARAVLEGRGDSVHDMMADADGRIIAVLPHGEVRAAFAELTGINVARGIGLLLEGDEEKADIRCGVAQFGIQDGVAHAQNIVFDTQDVRITGSGEVRLGSEELDLSIKGQPKKLRLTRIRTPIEINGHLRKPSIGVDTGKTLKQGAIATALGAVLTPFAAVLAFVDPGLAKDENCAALLKTAQSTSPEASQTKRR